MKGANKMKLPNEIITNPGINLGNPAYREYLEGAKQDNPLASMLLLEKILNSKRIANIRLRIQDPKSVVFIPIPPRLDSNNFLPLRVAEFLAHRLGCEVLHCLKLVHANGKRRTQNFWQRLLNLRKFEVLDSQGLTGKRIYLIDDHFTTGGTVRDAILALNKAGFWVDGVITLGSCFCKRLCPSNEQIQGFYMRFGTEGETLIRNITGLSPEELTYSELYGILKVRTMQELKEKVYPGELSVLPLFQQAYG